MMGVVGIDLTPERMKDVLTSYLSAYYDALDRAVDEAGGRLEIRVSGGDMWAPKFPAELRPPWAADIRATHDGQTFYVDIDGPIEHGVFVTQSLVIGLWWQGINDADQTFEINKLDIKPMRIRVFDDQELDLGEARAVSIGLIAAGRLMTALLDPLSGE